MFKSKKAALTTECVVVLGLLVALGVIFSMPYPYGLTFRVGDYMKFSPVFIVTALAARKYGVIAATAVSFLSDLLQCLLASSGAINVGISLSALLTGLIFGLLLHRNITIYRIIAAVLLTQVFCSYIIVTLSLWIMYSIPIDVLLIWRGLQTLIFIVAEIAFMYIVFIKTDVLRRIKFIRE